MAELRERIEQMEGQPTDSAEQTQLQNWLMIHSSEILPDGKADSWFVNDAAGRQLARNPWKSSIGQSYRHRSYFHGGDRDVPVDEAESLQPIQRPNLSAVYESTATHELKVSFTVPIWGDRVGADVLPIGVLGMSVKLGDFVQLDSELQGTRVVLTDLRTDWLEGEPRAGLVLDHPRLDAARLAQAARTGRSLLRLSDVQVEHFEHLRQRRRERRQWVERPANPVGDSEALQRDFRDPTSPAGAACVAAFEPVFVPGRDEAICDTGWVVIIEDLAGGDGHNP